MKAIQTKAILTSFRSKVDRSLGFSGVTPELSTDERAKFMELQGHEVLLSIVPQDSEGVYEVKGEMDAKTPSQRLRNVLYILWKQEGMDGDFDYYYQQKMESIIDRFKERIER